MKNIYDVIRQKEQEITELQREIEALRTAARLLADDEPAETYPTRSAPQTAQPLPARSNGVPMAAAAAAGALKEFP